MTEMIIKEVWTCPHCHNEYASECEAETCRDNCKPEPEDVYYGEEHMYQCECCRIVFDKEKDAEKCEAKHKKSGDLQYGEYLWRKSQKSLEKARNHPTQRILLQY